jgi:hypothetical protein
MMNALRSDAVVTGLKAGAIVHEELREAMASAEACLVLITPASGDRPWVQF